MTIELKKPPKSELPEDLRDKRQLGDGDEFTFACHAGLPCFSTCCADVNIILTPYDVLRLARRLEMDTKEFLDQHTLIPITKDLHLPVVLLKMGSEDKKCPFVGEEGCTVYESRPWACRMYPVMSGLPPARANEIPKPVYFLAEDDFCKGHGDGDVFTIASWMDNQQANDKPELDEGFQSIVAHPYFIGGVRQLNPKQIEMFYTGCYDLDAFRRFIFNTTFLERFELEDDLVASLRDNDEELLRFAFRWLRFAMFGEPTMTVRESAKREVVPPPSGD